MSFGVPWINTGGLLLSALLSMKEGSSYIALAPKILFSYIQVLLSQVPGIVVDWKLDSNVKSPLSSEFVLEGRSARCETRKHRHDGRGPSVREEGS